MSEFDFLDSASLEWVTWSDERCATCVRELPRYDARDGQEQRAWVDRDLGGVFCERGPAEAVVAV